MRPELCHFDKGTCRDEAWGLANCMQPHFVYLANSSGLKVGITRHSQIPTRWMDQGASSAMPLFEVASRFTSGLVEVMFKAHISDRTDWRKMLKGEPDDVDLKARGEELVELVEDDIFPKINVSRFQIMKLCRHRRFEPSTIRLSDIRTRSLPITLTKHRRLTGLTRGHKGPVSYFR